VAGAGGRVGEARSDTDSTVVVGVVKPMVQDQLNKSSTTACWLTISQRLVSNQSATSPAGCLHTTFCMPAIMLKRDPSSSVHVLLIILPCRWQCLLTETLLLCVLLSCCACWLCLQMPFVLGVLDDITLGPYSIMDAEHLHPHIAGARTQRPRWREGRGEGRCPPVGGCRAAGPGGGET
jgi:hypothetical protein